MKSIPVLGIPILNRADLLRRCIDSIDYPVDQLVIINNGREQDVKQYLEELADSRPNILIYTPPENLGVAGSWNWIMRNCDARWWLHVGNDIQFTAGDLSKICDYVESHPEEVVNPANWGHSLFAVKPHCLEVAGDFDSNFFPAYLEDSDHMWRIHLAGAKWSDVPDVHAIHGEAPTWGSHTIYSNERYLKMNGLTHNNLFLYYRKKWGGNPGQEKFTHPFNDPSWPIQQWELDQELRKANSCWEGQSG